MTACVRVPGEDGARVQHLAEFKTTVRGLLALRDWLKAHRVTQVAMEATGVYWKPVWHVLEDDFELLLVNAATSRTWRWSSTASPFGFRSRTVQFGRV